MLRIENRSYCNIYEIYEIYICDKSFYI